MAGALEGLKVLDLSRVVAGPMCAMMLADLGADVIKVERPIAGDDTRTWGPPYVGTESAYYLCVNRNKRSITVDIKSEAGRDLVRRLARGSDVLVENYKTGNLDRLGLGYESLREENPGLIYCSITGYGHTGPDAYQPGYDFVIQGRGGIMSITGEADGPPMKVGLAIVDVTAAMNATIAVLAAVEARRRTGLGQMIDIALLDSHVAWLINHASNYLVAGEVSKRRGNSAPNITPYGSYKASDGWFNIAVGNDSQFRRLCELIGAPELSTDPRFATNPGRVENDAQLVAILGEHFAQRSTAEWLDLFYKGNIPAGPVKSIPEVMEDPQVLAREMIVELPHPTAGSVRLVGSPLKMSETPVTYRSPPPLLGEHTDQILVEFGYSEEQIAALRAEGVV
ncbi:MAG TPA: CaiB/BaiF CoA-transferase family protein [Thermoleophilia bacterium]|nr:CaiB/BaiF CoA-transferase family protein [Thermoleophilia bacterium]